MEKIKLLAHSTAEISPNAQIGFGTKVWHQAQVREGAVIGNNCILGKDVYIDLDVVIGNNVKIQNGALIYHGATLEDGVFIGPQACLTNDRFPRAIRSDGDLKTENDWVVQPILIRYGASIGAGAIVMPGVTIGRFAMVAAGAVVTRDVPHHGLVMGVPAYLVGYACHCGQRLELIKGSWQCPHCNWSLQQESE
ncbi:MAG: transferase [Chloroflexi bacterium RBG_16_48_8]|nr:MAG: transferase [Chloroflexi bacterium RBG_16_48_8]